MRWMKDDAIDVRAIGDLLRRGEGVPFHRFEGDYLLLRQLSRGYWTQEKMISMAKNRIICTLDRLFPGLVLTEQSKKHQRYEPLFQSSLWECETMQALIRICPNPNRLAAMSNSQLIDLFHAHQQRMGPKTAARIIAYAQKVLAPPADIIPVYEQDLRRYLHDLDHHTAQLEEITPLMCQVLQETPYAILADVVGILPVMAAHLAGGLGDPARFPSASQVFRYSGLVCGRNDSGTKQRQGAGSSTTRAGNVYVRRALDRITGGCILHQPVIRHYYHKLLKTKPRGVARVACIRRTTGILWATIRDQRSEKFVMRGDTMTT